MPHTNAVHPGKVLLDELEERGISRSTLAEHIGAAPEKISMICRGKRGIDADMAVRLSRALGSSPGFWLNLQKNWELSRVERGAFKVKPVTV